MRTIEGGPPIFDDDVAMFERKSGVSLPPTYRDFLLRTNGGRPERDLFLVPGFPEGPSARIQVFLGLNDPIEACNLDWAREIFSDRIPEELLVIATTQGADMICMSLAPDTLGAVYYWDGVHVSLTYGELFWVADSFDEFITQLYRDENSPDIDTLEQT